MQSGATGIITLRIDNPMTQGRDQGPTGAFTRAWVPGLRGVPDAHLREPWQAERPLGDYPRPIVDVAAAARDRVVAHRQRPGFWEEVGAIASRHGSREAGTERGARRRGGDARRRETEL